MWNNGEIPKSNSKEVCDTGYEMPKHKDPNMKKFLEELKNEVCENTDDINKLSKSVSENADAIMSQIKNKIIIFISKHYAVLDKKITKWEKQTEDSNMFIEFLKDELGISNLENWDNIGEIVNSLKSSVNFEINNTLDYLTKILFETVDANDKPKFQYLRDSFFTSLSDYKTNNQSRMILTMLLCESSIDTLNAAFQGVDTKLIWPTLYEELWITPFAKKDIKDILDSTGMKFEDYNELVFVLGYKNWIKNENIISKIVDWMEKKSITVKHLEFYLTEQNLKIHESYLNKFLNKITEYQNKTNKNKAKRVGTYN